jgi:photosystem II stability/assembly factor-like uncharacterized protein
MKHIVTALALVALALPASALAQWNRIEHPLLTKDDVLFAHHAISAQQFFIGGIRIKMGGGGLPAIEAILLRTMDGGKLFQNIAGTLKGNLMYAAPIMAVQFRDYNRGWAAIGKAIAWSETAANWTRVELESTPTAFRMFPDKTGVAAGEGGFVWRTEDDGRNWQRIDPGTTVDFSSFFFLDSKRGWIAGAARTSREVGDGGQQATVYGDMEVWSTTDGGHTWTKSFTWAPTGNEDARIPGLIQILADGKTGYFVVEDWAESTQRTSRIRLLKTTDGGVTFDDTGLDPQVGEFAMFGNMPIMMNHVSVMHWDDQRNGRLLGYAYITETSGGGGGSTPIHRWVEMTTTDGGTWKKPDLGKITMDMTNPGALQADPRTFGGGFLNRFTGHAVGEGGSVWSWEFECVKTSDCGEGYECDRTLRCHEVEDQPGEDACPACDTGRDRDAAGGSPEAWPLEDGYQPRDLAAYWDQTGSSGGGNCSAGSGRAGTLPLALLAMVLLAILAQRRRPAG